MGLTCSRFWYHRPHQQWTVSTFFPTREDGERVCAARAATDGRMTPGLRRARCFSAELGWLGPKGSLVAMATDGGLGTHWEGGLASDGGRDACGCWNRQLALFYRLEPLSLSALVCSVNPLGPAAISTYSIPVLSDVSRHFILPRVRLSSWYSLCI